MIEAIARRNAHIVHTASLVRSNPTRLTRREFMFRTAGALLLTGIGFSHIACDDGTNKSSSGPSFPGDAQDGHPPSPTDNLYFVKYESGNAACVGLAGFRLGREDARWLGTQPGFAYVDGNVGGTGNTLEIISNSFGMYFSWAYDTLMSSRLFGGWQGQIVTENGDTNVRLGSSALEFLAEIPGAVRSGSSVSAGIPLNITSPDFTYNISADLSGDTITQIRIGMG